MKDLSDLINAWGKDLVKPDRIKTIRKELDKCISYSEIEKIRIKNRDLFRSDLDSVKMIFDARKRIRVLHQSIIKERKIAFIN